MKHKKAEVGDSYVNIKVNLPVITCPHCEMNFIVLGLGSDKETIDCVTQAVYGFTYCFYCGNSIGTMKGKER
jgi:hypothetical protein